MNMIIFIIYLSLFSFIQTCALFMMYTYYIRDNSHTCRVLDFYPYDTLSRVADLLDVYNM